jgi:hypothetical protein
LKAVRKRSKYKKMNRQNEILLELQYLPCIQYMSKFLAYDTVHIEQHENYLKGSYRNRAHLGGANGILRLSIPLRKGKNEQQDIRKVELAYDEPWLSHHWHSIQSAYGNSPYFPFYEEALSAVFQEKEQFLFDFNLKLLDTLLVQLGLPKNYKLTESFEKSPADIKDFRNGIFPKKHRQKEDADFEAPRYRQVFEEKNGFLPNLSILDLLFCTGPQAVLLLENAIIPPK